jgi:hypothetical protein
VLSLQKKLDAVAEVVAACREEVEHLVWSDAGGWDGEEEEGGHLQSTVSSVAAGEEPSTPRMDAAPAPAVAAVVEHVEEAAAGASLSLRELRERRFSSSPRSGGEGEGEDATED